MNQEQTHPSSEGLPVFANERNIKSQQFVDKIRQTISQFGNSVRTPSKLLGDIKMESDLASSLKSENITLPPENEKSQVGELSAARSEVAIQPKLANWKSFVNIWRSHRTN